MLRTHASCGLTLLVLASACSSAPPGSDAGTTSNTPAATTGSSGGGTTTSASASSSSTGATTRPATTGATTATTSSSRASGGGSSGGGSTGSTGSSAPSDAGPTAPIYATDAGFGTNVFSTDLDGWDISPDGGGQHDWYLTEFFGYPTTAPSCVGVDAGVLSITCGGNGNYQMATAGPAKTSAGWIGHAWGGGAYFEAELAFDPTLKSTGWPAFWSMAIEHLAGKGADQWPGQASGYAHFIEVDFFEYDATGSSAHSYGGAMHDWFGQYASGGYTNDANQGTGSSFDNYLIDVPATTDFTQFHRYGLLWIPSANGGQGLAQYYFDGLATTDRVTWSAGPPATPPPSGTQVFSILDSQHLAVILGTGTGWPLYVKSVNVWQGP